MEEVTPEMVQQLKDGFAERVKAKSAEFCPQDLERVKTDNLWLTRFIAHAENDMEAAITLLYDCCQWRKDFGTNDLDESKLPSHIFEKGVLFIRGKDNWGKTLLVFKAKQHSKGSEPIENLQKFIVYYFERIERETNSDQISIIFDMKDTGWNNMDMDFVRYLITLLKTYYPFFVNYLVIFEMPWLLNAAWKIIKGWLPPKFVDRVKFLDKKTLKDYIGEESQLVECGGKDDYKYKFVPEIRQKRSAGSSRLQPPEPKTRKTSKPYLPDESMVSRQSSGSSIATNDSDVDSIPSSIYTHGGNDERMEYEQPEYNSRSPPDSPMQAQTPSHDSFHASHSHSLVEVDNFIFFHSNESEDYVALLKAHNIDPEGSKVIFKIKTTSPDKYRVKPTIGVVDRNNVGQIVISTHSGVNAGSMLRDRFQLLVTRVPPDVRLSGHEASDVHSSPGNFQQLNTTFKRIVNAEGAHVETYRIGLKVEARPGDSAASGGAGMVSMSEDRMKKGLDDLEKKISESVLSKVNPKLARIQMWNYFLIALMLVLLFMSVLMWYKMPSSVCCSGNSADSCPSPIVSSSWTREVPTTEGQ